MAWIWLLIPLVAVYLFSVFLLPAAGRKTDMLTLWPMFKEHAASLQQAREGFVYHMALDPAWRGVADKWTEEEFDAWVESNLT